MIYDVAFPGSPDISTSSFRQGATDNRKFMQLYVVFGIGARELLLQYLLQGSGVVVNGHMYEERTPPMRQIAGADRTPTKYQMPTDANLHEFLKTWVISDVRWSH